MVIKYKITSQVNRFPLKINDRLKYLIICSHIDSLSRLETTTGSPNSALFYFFFYLSGPNSGVELGYPVAISWKQLHTSSHAWNSFACNRYVIIYIVRGDKWTSVTFSGDIYFLPKFSTPKSMNIYLL